MSNIPSSAIHAAFTPVQRASNDLLRARKVQADKASHHTEDVEELDDTAVSSVHERKQGGGNQRDRGKRKEEPEEKVEIARRYLVTRQCEANGLKPDQMQIGKKTLQQIVRDYTRDRDGRTTGIVFVLRDSLPRWVFIGLSRGRSGSHMPD